MATTAQTTDSLAISRIIYYTDNTANGVDQNPPFIPVNAPGVPGAGISYGGRPSGNQTITAAGVEGLCWRWRSRTLGYDKFIRCDGSIIYQVQ